MNNATIEIAPWSASLHRIFVAGEFVVALLNCIDRVSVFISFDVLRPLTIVVKRSD